MPKHKMTRRGVKIGIKYQHRLDVEKVIGRDLTQKEQVHHHYNKDGSVTLILCPDQQYHSLLHLRERALQCCGHANWGKCKYCKQYDDPINLIIDEFKTFHRNCFRKYHTEYMRKRRGSIRINPRLTDFD